ncbi:hypothetical protein ABIA38_005171 [Embleya sp. AB8]
MPVRHAAVTTRVGLAGSWWGAVGRLASWCGAGVGRPRVRSAGPGRGRWPPCRRCTSPPGPGSLLGAPHPLLPVHYVAVTARVGFLRLAVGGRCPLGVVVLGCCPGWPRVRSAGQGRGGGRRLVVARPLRGRGLCLVLRIRCCPSTTWPSLPGTASLVRGRGPLSARRRAVELVRGGPGSVRRGRVVAGGRRVVVARPLRGRGFCLVLRIRCCPSTTWPLPPGTASLARGRGRLCVGRRGVRPLRRRSGLLRFGRLPLGAWVCWLGLRRRGV